MATKDRAYAVKEKHSAELRALPGVCGVGVAKGKSGGLVIEIHVDSEDPNRGALLPKEIEGIPVEIVHSGPFRKL